MCRPRTRDDIVSELHDELTEKEKRVLGADLKHAIEKRKGDIAQFKEFDDDKDKLRQTFKNVSETTQYYKSL